MEPAEKIESLITPFLQQKGISLYDCDVVGNIGNRAVRLFIDCPGGITHDQCSEVSRHLSTLLDVEDIFPGAYTLEVSSPGLTRKLSKPRHFDKSAGALATVTFRNSWDGPRQITGRLAIDEGEETYTITDPKDGTTRTFTFADVSKARLEFEEK